MKNKLRDLRTARGWSQAELGIRVGVSRQAIIAIEMGEFDPVCPRVQTREALGLTIENMFDFDEA